MNGERLAELKQKHVGDDLPMTGREIHELLNAVVPERSESDCLQAEIGEWADRTFPSTVQERMVGVVRHLRREVDELMVEVLKVTQLADPTQAIKDAQVEAADCLILLFGLSHGMGFSLMDAVRGKHAVNLMRQWKAADQDGVREHV